MVQGYACDYGKIRCYDIRAVKAASEAYLDNGHIDLFVREPPESHPCGDLEKRQAQSVHILLITAEEVVDIFLGHQFAGIAGRPHDSHPLTEIHDVGRSVKTHLESAGGQGGSEHVRHRAFAVGAGDVYRPQTEVRVAKDTLKPKHVLQPRFVGIFERHLLNRRETSENRLQLILIILFGKRFHYPAMM